MKKMTAVTIDTREVGSAFGCMGVVISKRTGRVLARTDVMPYGMDGVAFRRAESIAKDRGYKLSEDTE